MYNRSHILCGSVLGYGKSAICGDLGNEGKGVFSEYGSDESILESD